ncbi:MAG: DNA polymerase I [Elusimicrobia bacterium]|nr:DNA polymerase I [Elusimicrobiota bacterium]
MTAAKIQRLYLIDAHAYLHRAYHALPPLRNSKGEPMGALYGFARMLMGVLKRDKPEFLAVCLDMPGPTFRHEKFAEYKATRKESDEDLRVQLARAGDVAAALGLKCFGVPGYEADDLMATLARLGVEEGLDVVLVTGDKDALQLVGGKIRVLNEAKGEMLDAGKVAEKFKVRPDQIVDYLALTGDASDNVPGVPGIGAVGAAKLLGKYGSLEGLLKAAAASDPDLSPKVAQALREHVESTKVGRELLALDLKAPVPCGPADCRVTPPEPDKLRESFLRFEFQSLLKELLPGAALPAAPAAAAPGRGAPGESLRGPSNGATVSVTLPEAPEVAEPVPVAEWLEAAGKSGAFALAFCPSADEVSTTQPGLPLTGCWAFALSLRGGPACLLGPDDAAKHRRELARLTTDPKVLKVAHDLKALLSPLREAELAVAGRRFDTMLAAWCLTPGNGKYDFASVWKSLGGSTLPAGEPASRAALRQAQLTWSLEAALSKALTQYGLTRLYEDLEIPLIDLLWEMEQNGIALDEPYLRKLREEFAAALVGLKADLDKLAGTELNPNSPKQLGKLLFEDLKLPPLHKTPGGAPSTDEETLSALAKLHPIPAKVLEYRELSKLQSTYVDALLACMDKGRRVHTRFNQAGAATGRMSSLDPNLQNIPIRTATGLKIRRAFVASEGHVLVSADYSQIDLRVLAHLSGDPVLAEAFRSGGDIHRRTAAEVFGVPADEVGDEMRRKAKAVNFGIVYGQTAFGLSQQLGISPAAAREFIDKYLARYRGVGEWTRRNLEEARREGCVKTILGRVRRLPDLAAKNTSVRQFNERAAGNAPIQGSSADIIKVAMLNIHRAMKSGKAPAAAKRVRPLLQVHDDLLFEVPEAQAAAFGDWLRTMMQDAVKLNVPLVVDVKVGKNWRDMEKVSPRG